MAAAGPDVAVQAMEERDRMKEQVEKKAAKIKAAGTLCWLSSHGV